MHGYRGQLLRVDLSAGKSWTEPLEESRARRYLGGRGLGARILMDEVPVGCDALGADNRLVFAMGPLAGTFAPGSGRFVVLGKSPATNGFGEAYTGGSVAHELKYAGYDGIVVQGKASEKVYLAITNDKVEIRPAARLAGQGTLDTEENIKAELNEPDARIISIGLAGEKGVRFACVMNDTDRAAGRTGLGAVMGAKNLKAIAIRGTGKVTVADPKAFRESSLANLAKIKKHPWLGDFPGSAGALGTAGGVEDLSSMGILPTRNWETGTWEYADRISGMGMKKTILIGHRACQSCPVGCTRVVQVADGPFAGARPEYGGPEYETVASFGSLCENNNIESIALLNQKCNVYGLDTISAGTMIAFAMECFEKGLLTEREIGFPLRWGDASAMVRLLDMIARREGVGDLLAEGTRRAAAKIGKGAAELAVEVKGLELGMHESRGKKGLALSYATAPRGADHMEGFHDPMVAAPNAWPELGIVKPMDRFTLADKADAVRLAEDYNSFINSLPICSFMSLPIAGIHNTKEITGMLAAATGWTDISFEEEMAIGERAYNLARAFTVRESGGTADDRLPAKLSRSLLGGASKDQVIADAELAPALQAYYRGRGWNDTGTPTQAKLASLGIGDVAQQLKGGSR
ncbi:MAG TPA: aldehyde ferredoxin oxidoreductase family protein [Candidatus Baltobacteraceae bacterium]|nr:aldehyde ferredoxin oxidoreductase family protein [Candidatus Baltobacteraceae bacterium]